MITDDEVIRLFEHADPARTTDDHDDAPDTTGNLAALRQRSNNVTYIQPTEKPPTPTSRRRFAMIAAAAAVVLVVGALVLATRGDDEGQEVPATVPATVPASTVATTTTPRSAAPAAAAVVDPVGKATGFLAAFATGDTATVDSLQADGFVMSYGWPGESMGGPLGERAWLGESYQVGSVTSYRDPTCTSVGGADGLAVVECETAMELAIHRFTSTEGLGATVTLSVTDDGVVAMESAYASSFGFDVLRPFDDWRDENRPDALPDDNDPETAAESLAFARTEAALVAEWAGWATDKVEGAFADHNAGDLDAFLARFDQSAAILGIESADAREVFSALMAGGQGYETSDCEPDGIRGGLAIVCDIVVRPPSYEDSGIELTGTIVMISMSDGTISTDEYQVDLQPFDDFNAAFEQWLLASHPDVHAQVTWVAVGDSRIPSADDQAVVAPYYDEFVAQSEVYPLGR